MYLLKLKVLKWRNQTKEINIVIVWNHDFLYAIPKAYGEDN